MAHSPFLTQTALEDILAAMPRLTIGVLGDLFLDRYLDIDGTRTEPSLETGLDAYQVVQVRAQPGAAGTVINNLAAFGVGRIVPIAFVGDDGEGHELWQALAEMPAVEKKWIAADRRRRTPTYTKPILHMPERPPRELNRFDIKNWQTVPEDLQNKIVKALEDVWPQVDALLVLDQVSQLDCGVVTQRIRERLAQLGDDQPHRFILADSRERIGLFRHVSLKPNRQECLKAIADATDVDVAAKTLAQKTNRAVLCTLGEEGMLLAWPDTEENVTIPAYPVQGEIDIVGAGDSSSAAIACAVAAGASLETAAAYGNLIASITIRQIGTTGTATPEQIWQRWKAVDGNHKPAG